VDTLNHAWFTGDTAELRRISSPECQSCTNFIESIEATYPGEYHRGGAAELSEVRVLGMANSSVDVVARWRSGDDERLAAATEKVSGSEAGFSAILSVQLTWEETHWRCLFLELIDSHVL
jgi:hypothetical protein